MDDYPHDKSDPVPQSRIARFARMGSLAGRVAGNVLMQGGRQLARGERPQVSELLLTAENMTRLADKLATMRGAAMKFGQLLSMDAGTLLPPELAAVMERLRADGVIMPATQLLQVLERNWGPDWDQQFSRFSFNPIAAASIGQVHRAETRDGRKLALKIQYPGVAQSIDSDLDNVVGLLRLSGLIPRGLDIDPLLAEARRQLQQEADYRQEAQLMALYQQHLESFQQSEQLLMPQCQPDLSGREILAMSYVEGTSLQQLRPGEADRVMSLLFSLFYAELLQFRCVQTDPNPANFLWQTEDQRLVLLDFGAVRSFSGEFVASYRRAILAAMEQQRDQLDAALNALGFFRQGIDVANREVILQIFILAAEPLRHRGAYDFAASDLAQRIQALGMSVSRQPKDWHSPPPDVLFLHRKMGGLFLLAARLGAKVNVHSLLMEQLQRSDDREEAL